MFLAGTTAVWITYRDVIGPTGRHAVRGCASAVPVDKRWRLAGQGWLARQEQDDAEPIRVVRDDPAAIRLIVTLVLGSVPGEPFFGSVEVS